jgi:hypothetical protein
MLNNNTFITAVGTFAASNSNFTSATSFGSASGQKSLTFPMTGNRTSPSGSQAGFGATAQLWASDNPGTLHRIIIGSTGGSANGANPTDGQTVRCIQE